MSILEYILNSFRWLSSSHFQTQRRAEGTRKVDDLYLPETGRSSVESTLGDRLSSAISFWGSVSPVVNFEALRLLKHLWIYNPDFSQYVANIINMANTGHEIVVDASSKRRAALAIDRINESAQRLYRNAAGIDGLLNAYIAQIAWSGALSSEDVVDFARRRVEKVVLVPVEQIRFRYLDGEYVAHQQPGIGAGLVSSPLGLLRLNEETYQYYALLTIENSPYAKPPGTAAIEPITGTQKEMLASIRHVAKKYGLFGLTAISVKRPEQLEDESDDKYLARATTYLNQIAASAKNINNTGLLVTYDDQTVNHESISSDFKAGSDLWSSSEQQVFSGLASFPAFHGRTDSTTETYANVVYNFMTAQSGNVQRLAKRRQERTYRLDCRLDGLEVNGISLGFNKTHARDRKGDADADLTQTETVILKAEKGLISPDMAAQELGYDSAYDPTLLNANTDVAQRLQAIDKNRNSLVPSERVSVKFRFDKNSQSYKFVPDVLELGMKKMIEQSEKQPESFKPSSNGHKVPAPAERLRIF